MIPDPNTNSKARRKSAGPFPLHKAGFSESGIFHRCRWDISHAVQAYVEANGFSVVREYVGHGVGRNMHEAPEIPNYGAPGHGPKLIRGMTIAVEPMVNAGTAAIRQMSDGWTVKTRDGKYAAHYENTILVTDGEPEILTAPAP